MAFSVLRDLMDLLDRKPSTNEPKYKILVEGLSYNYKINRLGEKEYTLRFSDREMLSFAKSLIGLFLSAQEFEKNLHATFALIFSKLDMAEKSPSNIVEVKLSEDEMVDLFGLFDEMEEQSESLSPEELDDLNNVHNLMYNYQLLEKNAKFISPATAIA